MKVAKAKVIVDMGLAAKEEAQAAKTENATKESFHSPPYLVSQSFYAPVLQYI